jgi:hypothetical protein
VLYARYAGDIDQFYLWTVVPGSEPVRIPGTEGARAGRWSPDGRVIAFAVWNDGIYLINADGSGRRKIFTPDGFDVVGWPVWSPDGTRLTFPVYAQSEAQFHMEIIDSLDADTTRVDTGLEYAWEWLEDGSFLGETTSNIYAPTRPGEIARYYPDGTLEVLTDTADFAEGVPRLSPDGTTISFLAWEASTSLYHLGLMSLDGSNYRLIKTLGTQVTWPAWSPKGNEIAFGPTVTAITLDGQHERLLGGGYGEDGFDWAPIAGTTEDFDITGVRGLALPDPSVVATASTSTGTVKPSTAASLLTAATIPGSVTIRQAVAEPAYVSLRIYKPSGSLMKTVSYGLKTGAVAYKWKGRLPSGALAPTGKYKFVAKAVDLAGNVKTKTMYVAVVR